MSVKFCSKLKQLLIFSAAMLLFCACGEENDIRRTDIPAHETDDSSLPDIPSAEEKSSSTQSSDEPSSGSQPSSSRSSSEPSSSALPSGSQSSDEPSAALPSNTQPENASADDKSSENSPGPTEGVFGDDSGRDSLSPLHVDGTYLVNEAGEHVQLYGMSTHGLSFFPEYVNYDTFATLRNDWGTNCVRLAMYTAEYNGYCISGNENKEALKNLIRNGVQYATDLGMYVIVDWHILSDQDPNVYKEDAKTFFMQMSEEFADHTNVLYEICNEPNGYATWESVKSYAEEVIPCIRQNDEDAVILIGSPTWSQDIDKALANPVNADNIMYTLHFYAGTHKEYLRERMENCINGGLPVFISEFGMCDASGNGGNDFDSAGKWMELINKYEISFMCWNLANKNESSSVIRSDVTKVSGWSEDELSDSGKWIRNVFRNK